MMMMPTHVMMHNWSTVFIFVPTCDDGYVARVKLKPIHWWSLTHTTTPYVPHVPHVHMYSVQWVPPSPYLIIALPLCGHDLTFYSRSEFNISNKESLEECTIAQWISFYSPDLSEEEQVLPGEKCGQTLDGEFDHHYANLERTHQTYVVVPGKLDYLAMG